jgi:hypothetical protein
VASGCGTAAMAEAFVYRPDVRQSVELGYATTVHTAQGVTADTMHGLVTGEESRQQLYTMLTRGRIANHLYMQVVGDGDTHWYGPGPCVRSPPPTYLLEQILARDDAARSATTLRREAADPAGLLGDTAARYVDALQMAAEDLAGPQLVEALELAADQIVPGLTDEPAWPSLRAHLLLLAAHGKDPTTELAAAAGSRELDSADDRAAVLDWRLDDTSRNTGPLPWLPDIPTSLGRVPGRPIRAGRHAGQPSQSHAGRHGVFRNGPPSAALPCLATWLRRCRCGESPCKSIPGPASHRARATAESRPHLAAAPQPIGGR